MSAIARVEVTLADTMSRISVSRRSFCARPNGSRRGAAAASERWSLSRKKRMPSVNSRLKTTDTAPFTTLPARDAKPPARPPRLAETRATMSSSAGRKGIR